MNAAAQNRITLARTWGGGDVASADGMRFVVPVRTLHAGPNPLAQAIAEIGRIDKTIHTLNFIDDETRRRGTLLQLNLGEGRHSLAGEVFHGKRGELFQRYREGQEDQLSALGLVVNIIVLWNTLYMDAVRGELRPLTKMDDD